MNYLEIARRVIARQKSEQGVTVAEPVALSRTSPDIDDYMAIFYARAAICEFDGGLDRVNAERVAMRQVLATFREQGVELKRLCMVSWLYEPGKRHTSGKSRGEGRVESLQDERLRDPGSRTRVQLGRAHKKFWTTFGPKMGGFDHLITSGQRRRVGNGTRTKATCTPD